MKCSFFFAALCPAVCAYLFCLCIGTYLSFRACVHSFLSPSSAKSSFLFCVPHSASFSPLELLFELCLLIKLPICVPHFSFPPSSTQSSFPFRPQYPHVLESLTPLGSLLSLPRLPLNPIFHSWTTANFPPVPPNSAPYTAGARLITHN